MKQHYPKTNKYITVICSTSMTVLLIMRDYNEEFINIILSDPLRGGKIFSFCYL